jgi:hypothetical protein
MDKIRGNVIIYACQIAHFYEEVTPYSPSCLEEVFSETTAVAPILQGYYRTGAIPLQLAFL